MAFLALPTPRLVMRLRALTLTACLGIAPGLVAQSDGVTLIDTTPEATASPRYLAEIKLNTAQEFQAVLQRADRLFEQGRFEGGDSSQADSKQDSATTVAPKASPVTFLLHGAEARVLLKSNYGSNRDIVNLAARLSAFEVVEIRVCDTWMARNNISPAELPPFVGTVRYAPKEKKRLLKEEEYVYF